VVLLATLWLLAAAPGPSAAASDPGLAASERLVADAFNRADADRLAGALSQRLKTYVACAALGVGDGYYGADQMRILLRRLFRDRETVRFRPLPPPMAPRADGTAVAMVAWTYRDAGSPPAETRLALSFAREPDGWRLREIRDLK
jgi:hypothetical protein